MSNVDENELVEGCKRGDRNAMAALVTQYQKPVYNAAFRMLGNAEDAADVTQTAFLKSIESIDRFNPKFKFFSWIYRIALNESLNQLKRRKGEPLSDTEQAEGPGPADMATTDQIGDEVQSALMTLNEAQRSVLVLRYFSECSYRQIGEILQIPEKTVKSRLFSARQQMKTRLEKDGVTA